MAGRPELQAAIFDVDGVLVDAPHEQAWRETLDELMAGPWDDLAREIGYEAGALTSERYQGAVAGRARADGARAGLEAVGVPSPVAEQVETFADAKQARLLELLERSPPLVFPDAIALLLSLREAGLAIATASASRNASRLLAAAALPDGRALAAVIDVDVSGLDGPGKPDPAMFLEAARRLDRVPEACLVVEDAPAGVEAARRGGMATLAIDRSGDAGALRASGADLVLEQLDSVPAAELLAQLRDA